MGRTEKSVPPLAASGGRVPRSLTLTRLPDRGRHLSQTSGDDDDDRIAHRGTEGLILTVCTDSSRLGIVDAHAEGGAFQAGRSAPK